MADMAGEPTRLGAHAVLERIAAQSDAQRGAENFSVAMRLLPRRPRAQLRRVYTFARFVDDVGDRAPGDRRHLLDLVDEDLRALPHGGARLAAVRGLQSVLDQRAVPLEPFLELVEANRVDQTTTRYETFADLLGYCRLSAAPVGRIVLHIADAASPANVADSDLVCAGLQVLEHCQDVGEDARAGRVYLPAGELRSARLGTADLLAASTDARLRVVLAAQVGRADDLLGRGPALARRLTGWARLAVAGYVAGGQATAAALRRADFEVLTGPVRPATVSRVARTARIVAPW
jgi:squalene synthase HpnC